MEGHQEVSYRDPCAYGRQMLRSSVRRLPWPGVQWERYILDLQKTEQPRTKEGLERVSPGPDYSAGSVELDKGILSGLCSLPHMCMGSPCSCCRFWPSLGRQEAPMWLGSVPGQGRAWWRLGQRESHL